MKRFQILISAWLATILVSAMPSAAHNIDYKLRLYDVDDNLSATVQNGMDIVLSRTYPFYTDTTIDISNLIASGPSTILLSLSNIWSGYTYGFSLFENGVQIVDAHCGVFNIKGCNGDSYQSGNVMNARIALDGLSGLLSSVSVSFTDPNALRVPITPETTPVLTVNPAFLATPAPTVGTGLGALMLGLLTLWGSAARGKFRRR